MAYAVQYNPALYLTCPRCAAIVLIALVKTIGQCPCGERVELPTPAAGDAQEGNGHPRGTPGGP